MDMMRWRYKSPRRTQEVLAVTLDFAMEGAYMKIASQLVWSEEHEMFTHTRSCQEYYRYTAHGRGYL